MQPRTCSLLISTYNWPQSLNLVLQSALSQTQPPTEILIADDGSREETRRLIEQFQRDNTIPIRHSWHEDVGFRKAKILNKTMVLSASDYIIQIDGDCILHPKFVEDHMNAAEKGVYLYGSRVNILPDAVADILANGQIEFKFLSNRIKNKTRNLHIPFLSKLYRASAGFSGKFRGCNVSFWREDFMTVNGYNEEYEGWGREDSDLVIRMGNSGIKAKRLRYAGILYHIHHQMNSRDNFGLNDLIQREAIEKKVVRIARGVDQYLNGS